MSENPNFESSQGSFRTERSFEDFLTGLIVRFREELEPSLEEIQRREKIEVDAEKEFHDLLVEIEKQGHEGSLEIKFIYLSNVWFAKLGQTHLHLSFVMTSSGKQGTFILRWSVKPPPVDLVMDLFQLPPTSRSVLEKMKLDYQKVESLIKSVTNAEFTVKELKEIVINQTPSEYKFMAQKLLVQEEKRNQAWKDSISFLIDMIAKSVEM
jgi:hypothetical protein